VPATPVTTGEALAAEIKRCLAEPRPHLIEMVFGGKAHEKGDPICKKIIC